MTDNTAREGSQILGATEEASEFANLLLQEFKVQCKAIVKVHGVFPSGRGYTASSQRFQFH